MLSNKCEFNLLKDLVHQELLYVDLINIKHLELSIETADFLYCDGPFQRYVHRLIEACGSLETLVIKVCVKVKQSILIWGSH